MDLSHPRIYVKENGRTVAKPVDLCHPIGDLSDAIFASKEDDDDDDANSIVEPTPDSCVCFYSADDQLGNVEIERL